MTNEVVYLLHFKEPYPAGKRPQHYLGHAEEGKFEHRLDEHRRGSSKARFTQVMAIAGIEFVVARVWQQGSYQLEQELKRRKRPAGLCPVCVFQATTTPSRKTLEAWADANLLLDDLERWACTMCGTPHQWYELEPGSGRCDICRP